MSNETPSDKKTHPQQQAQPDSKLTRVPVKWLYFNAETYTISSWGSGYSTMSNLGTTDPRKDPTKDGFRPYCTCSFIPAWGMFETILHRQEGEEKPAVTMIGREHVLRWDP